MVNFLRESRVWSRFVPVVLALVVAVPCGLWGQGKEVPRVPVERERKIRRSESISGQFQIYGDSLKARGAFAVFVEEIKKDFLGLTGQPDRWKSPVVIKLVETPIDVTPGTVRSKFEQVEGAGFRLELTVELSDQFTREELRFELVRVLLAEQILRNWRQDVGHGGRLLPPWLLAGMSEAITYRRSRRPGELFVSILGGGRLLGIDEILDTEPVGLDSISLAVYNASCAALVLTLLDQPSGETRFNQMIGRLARREKSEKELLKHTFPGLRLSRNSLEKWWTLQVASLAEPSVFDPMSAAETDARLTRATELIYPKPEEEKKPERRWTSLFRKKEKNPEEKEESPEDGEKEEVNAPEVVRAEIGEFAAILEMKNLGGILKRNQLALLKLEQRAFPLMRPVVSRYQEVFKKMVKGETKGLEETLAELEAVRAELLEDARNVEDYLDWYEATQRSKLSGAFDVYQKSARELRAQKPVRRDPISRYLDAMEEEIGRGGDGG